MTTNPELKDPESYGAVSVGITHKLSDSSPTTEHAIHSSTDLRVYFWEFVPQLIVISKHLLWVNFLGVCTYVCESTHVHILCILTPASGKSLGSTPMHIRTRIVSCGVTGSG